MNGDENDRRLLISEVGIPIYKNLSEDQICEKSLKSLFEDGQVAASNKYRERILLQIDHCLLQIEQDHITHNLLLCPTKIFIKNIDRGQKKNSRFILSIRKLADVYCFVLTGKSLDEYATQPLTVGDFRGYCDDHRTALDLVKKMTTEEDFTIEEVLQHPFHWNKKEKIKFICEAYSRFLPQGDNIESNEFEKKTNEAVKKYGINVAEEPIKDWIKKLELSSDDVENLNSQNATVHTVSTQTIYDLACGKTGEPKFNTNSIFHLMKFFRNHCLHFSERNKKVQIAFGDSMEGYWDFYFVRFPSLFIHVYSKMRSLMTHYEVPAMYKHLPKIAEGR